MNADNLEDIRLTNNVGPDELVNYYVCGSTVLRSFANTNDFPTDVFLYCVSLDSVT